jgi:RNA polymerase sigma-70 factor (ECF subfamily)
MLGVCYRYTKSLDDAEDVLQESFIKVFTKLKQFTSEGNFEGWIKKIVINTAINYLHKHNRYKKELMQTKCAMHVISNDNPDWVMDEKDLVELIRQLPGNYKIVFNLIAVEGYDYKEVCDLLKLNINTARSTYSRARAMLIDKIKKHNNESLSHYERTV